MNMNKINILKENGINVDKGIELLGDIETYNEILQDFLSEMEERLPNIEKYKNDLDMENYAIIVHAVKGDAKYLGMDNLADIALQHQLKSQDNNISYINEHYNELIEEITKIIKVINKYFN